MQPINHLVVALLRFSACALALLLQICAQELVIDPRATFLRTAPSDTPSGPLVVDLAALGYRPGQQITIRTNGDFVAEPSFSLTSSDAVAVFSRTSTVLPSGDRFRVPDAIQASAPAYFTAPAQPGALDNDIVEDFLVTPAGLVVTIPDNGVGGVPLLLVGADDNFWGHNTDPEIDFAIVLQRPLGDQLLANPGFEVSGTAGWSVHSGVPSVTSYGLSNTPPVAISTAINGGLRLLRGGCSVQQSFDLSGDASAIDNGEMFIRLGGSFGGFSDQGNQSDIAVLFDNGAGGSTGSTQSVGLSGWWQRAGVTTLMKREGVFPIPSGTRLIRCRVNLGASSFADNLRAELLRNWSPDPQALGVNLVQGGDFEGASYIDPAASNPWLVVETTQGANGWGLALDNYGSATAPPLAVATQVAGGARLIYGHGVIRQTWDLSAMAIDVDAGRLFVEVAGYFGGRNQEGGFCQLEAVFENGLGGSTGPRESVGGLTWTQRVGETTVIRMQKVVQIPVGTRRLHGDLRLNNGNNGSRAFADNLQVLLVRDWSPNPVLYDVNLIENGTFESGSIVSPNSLSSWLTSETPSGFGFTIDSYGSTRVPSAIIGASIGGGSRIIRGNGVLRQTVDVRGNANDVDSGLVFLDLSGYFGSSSTTGNHWARLEAVFRGDLGGSTGATVSVGTVNILNLNWQNSIMYRGGVFPVFPGTRFIQLQLRFNGPDGYADNLRAFLRRSWTPPLVPLGVELLENTDFEIGNMVNPAAVSNWFLRTGNGIALANYGAPSMPLPAVSNSIGGGSFLVRGSNNNQVMQTFDLTSRGAEIDQQRIAVDIAGYFGGIGANSGTARLYVEAFSQFGGSIPVLDSVIGNVTPAQRSSVTTLLPRSGRVTLPFGTRSINVVLELTDSNGLADNVSARLVDITAPPLFPGTGDGLILLSGVNALPSGGPREDSKVANAGNLLTMRIQSQGPRYHGAPLFFACNAFPSNGSVPPFGVPGLHLNLAVAGFSWLLDGVTPQGPFGPSVVLPGGTAMSFVVPPGLAGWSMLFQALVLSPNSSNFFYATSDGHVIRFL